MADKPFDPDEFIRQAPPFDPDAFLRATTPPPGEPLPGSDAAAEAGHQALKDVLRLGGNAATFGMWPRVAGGLDALTSDKTYSEGVNEQVALANAAKQRLGGLASSTAEAGGGAVSGAGLLRGGATLLGRVAQLPWWQRLGAGALESGAYGAAHGAGSTYSENLPDYIKNAQVGGAFGTVLGLGLPLAGSAASAIYRTAADKIAGIPTALGRAARADAQGLAALPRMGDEAMLLDAGPSMQSVAQAYVQGTGPARTKIVNALAERDKATVPRLERDVTAAAKRAETPSYLETGVTDRMAALQPAYEAILNSPNVRAVDTAPIAKWLDRVVINSTGAARSQAQRIRADLDVHGAPGNLDPHPTKLQAVRSDIKAILQKDKATPGGTLQSNERGILENLDKRMTAELQAKVPGIRHLDSQYAELGSQERALSHTSPGARMFDTAEPGVIRPNELRDILAEASMPKGSNVGPSAEGFRLQQRARAELDRRLATGSNDLNTLERTIGTPEDYNAQKMSIMFGQQPAEDIAASVARNRLFRESRQRITQGSDTSQRQQALAENELKPITSVPNLYSRLESMALYPVNKVRSLEHERMRERMADRLTAMGAARDAEVQRLLEHNASVLPMSAVVDKYARAATQGLGGVLNPFTETFSEGKR